MKSLKKWYEAAFGHEPPPPAAGYEIPAHEGASFNLCLTTLLAPRTAPSWERNNLVAAPWTEVLALPAFDPFRDAADRYYKACDAAGSLVPTVTRHEGSIRVEFEVGGYLSVALFDPGQTRMGSGRRGEPIDFRPVDEGAVVA